MLNILDKRVLKVYLNEDGVSVYSGLFPWNAGYSGIDWVNIQHANFQTGFGSWLLKSYSIRVFDYHSEYASISLSHIRHGDRLVEEINRIVKEKRR